MSIETYKLSVLQKIMKVNDSDLLYKINDLLDKEMIVAFSVNGKPLTEKEYNNRLQIAEEQIRSGEYISQEDIEAESEDW